MSSRYPSLQWKRRITLAMIVIVVIGSFQTQILAQDLKTAVSKNETKEKNDDSGSGQEANVNADFVYRKTNSVVHSNSSMSKTNFVIPDVEINAGRFPNFNPNQVAIDKHHRRNHTGLFVLLIAIAGAAAGAALAATSDNKAKAYVPSLPKLPRGPIYKF